MMKQPVELDDSRIRSSDQQSHHATALPQDAEQLAADTAGLKRLVKHCLGGQLDQVELALAATLESRHQAVANLARQASAMGGKRLRPMLVLLSAQAATPPDSNRPSARDQQDLTRIAVAVELVHAASLIHDDVMDHAESRRHLPTIYKLEGNSAAILVGDFLFTKAYASAAGCRSTLPARRIAAAATQLCEGELRQQMSADNWTLPLSDYYSQLVQKTASLCAASCRLGAWQVGAPLQQQRGLERFGKHLGLAFQIYDDWLDYWGTSQVGKTLGTDLAQHKPTLPLLYFLRDSSPEQAGRLLQLLTSGSVEQRQDACEMIRQSSAGERTLRTARRWIDKALAGLQTLSQSPAKSALEAIARFSVHRQA
ncbi:MAG: polyprenyl synthetase family protein [Pirellulaceae bacterium]|nr:polyprenyl synthetase family protein [Pirellulaceae bacterium]